PMTPILCDCLATVSMYSYVFFNDTATTEIYTLSLHDALPIFRDRQLNIDKKRQDSPERKVPRALRRVDEEVVYRNDRRMPLGPTDRKSTRLNSSHVKISYAVFCLKKKKKRKTQ